MQMAKFHFDQSILILFDIPHTFTGSLTSFEMERKFVYLVGILSVQCQDHSPVNSHLLYLNECNIQNKNFSTRIQFYHEQI